MFKNPEQSLRALINFSPLAILALTQDGKVSEWNPAAEQMFGWSASEVLGHINPIIPPETRTEYELELLRLCDGHTIRGKEAVRLHKSGHMVDVMLWAAPILTEKGDSAGSTAVFEDITERIHVEDKLHASEERQEQMQAQL